MISLLNAKSMVMICIYALFQLKYTTVMWTSIFLLCLLITSLLWFTLHSKKKRQDVIVEPILNATSAISERLEELNKDLRPFGFAYNPTEDIFYSLNNCWQRKFGYCQLYDEAAAIFSMIIDCEPIAFKYKGTNYLIEFWKGQYGVTTGAEVGIYYTMLPSLKVPGVFNGTLYQAVKDNDRISMSFVLRKNGNLLFTRSAYHWWTSGFKLGEYSTPEELTMDITLILYDHRMAVIFGKALKQLGYSSNDYSIDGKKVQIHFDKPHSVQSIARTKLTERIMQKNNQIFCETYHRLTKPFSDTLDKLEIIRCESPDLYRQILPMGKPKEVFESYNKIVNLFKS